MIEPQTAPSMWYRTLISMPSPAVGQDIMMLGNLLQIHEKQMGPKSMSVPWEGPRTLIKGKKKQK